jgi:hypothetical protein
MDDLREVTSFAAEIAQLVLTIFEEAHPADSRPRDAIDAAWMFARGGSRGKWLRDTAWAAQRAARDADTEAAAHAARSAMPAASVAYLHPLAEAHQVKHFWAQQPTGRERPSSWRATIEPSVLFAPSKLAGARSRSSLTCSAASPRRRPAEGASGSGFAIWIRPSAPTLKALSYPSGDNAQAVSLRRAPACSTWFRGGRLSDSESWRRSR